MDIIIGAGISGISYANFTKNPYLILEADQQIGGYCKTIKKDGFVWDYSGHFFHFRNKWLEDFVCRHIDAQTILRCEKHTQIKYKDLYVDFPFQKNIHQLDKQEFIDCLYDLFTAGQGECSTFKQMLYNKFGRSIAEKFLIPYNEKLYACELDLLDIDAMGRFFPYADKEEIVRNFKNADNSSYNSHFTYPRGGAVEYVNSLARNIDPENICLGEKVLGIDLAEKKVRTNLRTLSFDNLISTIPFPVLLDMGNVPHNRELYSWNKVLVFNLGFDKKGVDRVNNWIYFPDKNCTFYRIGYYDNIFNSEKMSLYVEIGFDKNAEIDVDYYRQKVLDDLKANGIVTDHRLVAEHYVVMDPAYVHITDRSVSDLRSKKEELSAAGVYSIGRYGSWTYCSIEDNILEAKQLSESLSGMKIS